MNLPPQLQGVFDTVKVDLPGGFVAQPSYLQAGAIVFLIFLLILTLGQFRRRLLSWHMRGFIPGIAFGIILALIVEGFLLVSGGTVFTKVLGWENAPEPVANALDQGKMKLVDVLGARDNITEIPQEIQIDSTGLLLEAYEGLDEEDADSFKMLICTP